MAMFIYLIFVAISFVPFVLTTILYNKRKSKTLSALFFISLGLVTYSLICSLEFASSGKYSKKSTLLYAEKDFLLGVDRIHLYEDWTFKIEYGDHLYFGTYRYENDLLTLDINYNVLLPFRSDLPEVYKIVNSEFTDVKTGNPYFGICDEQELKRLNDVN